MSAAAPTIADATAAAPKKGKKKLIIMIAAAVLVLAAGGGAAMVMMKKKAADAEAAAAADDGDEKHAAAPKKKAKDEHHAAPVFLPLEPFVVNLADKDADRFAQVGITLEIEGEKASEELKAYMPAIRNGILMVLSHKTSKELMELTGKQELAAAIKREAVRPLGFDLPEPEKVAKDEAAGDDEDKPKKKKKKKAEAEEETPVKNVLFSSFIIQ